MRTQWVDDPHRLASTLHHAYVGQDCVVNLRRGVDKLGQAVMRVERVYVDDRVPETRMLRVVGHLPDSQEHGSIALPLGGPAWAVMPAGEGERATVFAGEYQLNVVPVDW